MTDEQSSEGRIESDLKIDALENVIGKKSDRFLAIGVNWNEVNENVRKNTRRYPKIRIFIEKKKLQFTKESNNQKHNEQVTVDYCIFIRWTFSIFYINHNLCSKTFIKSHNILYNSLLFFIIQFSIILYFIYSNFSTLDNSSLSRIFSFWNSTKNISKENSNKRSEVLIALERHDASLAGKC